MTLAPGDLLVAYTDGISEAMNGRTRSGGEERMGEAVEAGAPQPAAPW